MRPLSPVPADDKGPRTCLPVPVPRRSAGPGPSKLAYRLSRTWAKPGVRSLVLVYLPIVALGIAGWRVVSDDGLRLAAEAKVTAAWESIVQRPEFALEGVQITGGSDRLRAQVHRALGLPRGASSLGVSVTDLRERVEALGGVATASVQLDPQGILRVHVIAREPVALLRRADGTLVSLDREGTVIADVSRRAAHPTLPVLMGAGARDAVAEALALMESAPEVVPRLRAFVRVGKRRWDMVLADERRIMLPAEAPGTALARILALHYVEEILDRDVAVIDMRVPDRPTLRLTAQAAETMRLRRAVKATKGEDT